MDSQGDIESREAFVFRVGTDWFACEPELVESVMLVQASRQFRVPSGGEGVIDDTGRARVLRSDGLKPGGVADAPEEASRVVCFADHGARQAVRSDEVIGLVNIQCDGKGRTVLSVLDAHGHEQTLVLRTDVLESFFQVSS